MGWNFWINLADIVTALATVIALVVAVFTIRSSVKTWKWTFFTKEWSALIQCLQQHTSYMEKARADDYRRSFTGEAALGYEMTARLCIGYLDDLYFLGSRKELRSWFRGSVKLFASTHRQWLEDHRDAYDPAFYEFIMGELDPTPKQMPRWRFWDRRGR